MKIPNSVSGFSLIELLVSISIIAVLISLLLPAVQAARESARKISCRNHLKQIGIALHNYHDSHSTLPIGSRRQFGVGPSWWVGLLPFLEQENLYDKFDANMKSNGLNPSNPALAEYVEIPVMLCPSAAINTQLVTIAPTPIRLLPCYVGISGAIPDLSGMFDDGGFQESRLSTCCFPLTTSTIGAVSAGGALIPNDSISFHEIKDGLSNTIVVGEQNGFLKRTNGSTSQMEASSNSGWAAGTNSIGVPPNYVPNSGTVPTIPSNLTTIAYPPNFSIYENTIYKGIQVGAGPNNPLMSPHAGGVNVLLTDGSATFLSETLSLSTLKRLATRDDGYVPGEF